MAENIMRLDVHLIYDQEMYCAAVSLDPQSK